jgi:glycosyltransferase involved in cell wall biosynthesis
MASNGKQRVVFVADELLGYAGNGIGTTTTFVSLALARRGHHVEILFAGRRRQEVVDPEWQSLYDAAGVRVHEVPDTGANVEPGYFARSREVETALRADPPDVVVVQDLGAPAYTALRLRSLGLAFEHTFFVVFCHGTRQWITDVSRKANVLPGAHAVSVLERASVELADAVVSPSAYLIDWMRGEGWHLPEQTFVIHHVSRMAATGEPRLTPPPTSNGIDRVAFFGRLEERKGVRPFVDALNALEPELLRRLDVEFIGRPTPPWPVERVHALLSEQTRSTLRGFSFATGLDQHEALARLRRPGTLAVMPSFEENSPNVIYECLENQIPFIASTAAGIRELIAAEDHARVLFDPTQDGIADGLRRAIGNEAPFLPASPAFDDEDSLRRWEEVLALTVRTPPRADGTEPGPEWLLSIGDEDVPEPALVETLVRAQQVSGADVVTCGVVVAGKEHIFVGEPRGLGLLSNGYGTVALMRRSLVDCDAVEPIWPRLARLSLSGVKIVSVPAPLVTQVTAPATLRTHPEEGRLVFGYFEQALPQKLRFTAELAARLAAAAAERPAASARRSLPRRALRRLLRRIRS